MTSLKKKSQNEKLQLCLRDQRAFWGTKENSFFSAVLITKQSEFTEGKKG